MYDPIDYWNRRVEPTSTSKEQTDLQIEYIKSHIPDQEPLNILDFGVGVGRTFPAYPNRATCTVIGWDISTLYARRVMAKAKEYDFKFVCCLSQDYDPHLFYTDVTIASEVLLHIPPEKIVETMRQLTGAPGRSVDTIVITWWQDRMPAGLSPHCFLHDYKKICEENKWVITDWQEVGGQVFFVYGE